MKNLIRKGFRKVLAGVLSCCMLLNGCGAATQEEISWQLEEEETTVGTESSTNEVSETVFTQESLIYVYICGAVVNPGVYEIAEGSRLFEAIDIAGGMLETADMDSHNLARVLQDGEQIQIFTEEEVIELEKCGLSVQVTDTAKDNGLININTASVQELTTLTGIGESRAQAIIEYREVNGFFKNIDAIKNVTGIKDGLFEKIKNKITV